MVSICSSGWGLYFYCLTGLTRLNLLPDILFRNGVIRFCGIIARVDADL